MLQLGQFFQLSVDLAGQFFDDLRIDLFFQTRNVHRGATDRDRVGRQAFQDLQQFQQAVNRRTSDGLLIENPLDQFNTAVCTSPDR